MRGFHPRHPPLPKTGEERKPRARTRTRTRARTRRGLPLITKVTVTGWFNRVQ